jgi:hypothetical protein
MDLSKERAQSLPVNKDILGRGTEYLIVPSNDDMMR